MGNTCRLLLVAFVLPLFFLPMRQGIRKDKVFLFPRAFNAKTYPAHETHDDEKVRLRAILMTCRKKQSAVFTVDYKKEGLLPFS